MRTLLLTIAMLGTVIGLSILALQYAIYRDQNSPEGLHEQRRVAEATKAREELNTRVAALSADRCEVLIAQILAHNSHVAIVTFRDIPPRLAADIALCLKREIISPYAKDRLVDVNLMRFFG